MVADNKKWAEYEAETKKIKRAQQLERRSINALREKRRKELFDIENIRNSMKPIHMPAREYKMMLAKERKAQIDRE